MKHAIDPMPKKENNCCHLTDGLNRPVMKNFISGKILTLTVWTILSKKAFCTVIGLQNRKEKTPITC
jgi:hypothetical protein